MLFSRLLQLRVQLLVLLDEDLLELLKGAIFFLVPRRLGVLLVSCLNQGGSLICCACLIAGACTQYRRLDLLIYLQGLLELADLLLEHLVLFLKVGDLLRLVVVLGAKGGRWPQELVTSCCQCTESIAGCVVRVVGLRLVVCRES